MLPRSRSAAARGFHRHLLRLKIRDSRLLFAQPALRVARGTERPLDGFQLKRELTDPPFRFANVNKVTLEQTRTSDSSPRHTPAAEHEATAPNVTIRNPILKRHVSGQNFTSQPGLQEAKEQPTQWPSLRYMLTLTTTTILQQTLTSLRNQHFDPKYNKQAAHLKLFQVLPPHETYRIIRDIQVAVATTDSFPLRAADNATQYPYDLRITFTHGTEPANALYQTLQHKWAPFLHPLDSKHKSLHLAAIVQGRGVPDSQRIASLDTLNAQLRAIAALGGGGPQVTAPVAEGGGSLRGVATGVALFKVKEGRCQFVRRYNFRDVPSRGWHAPEKLSIPMLEGMDEPDGIIRLPS